jgi:hypothetical protein
VRICLTPGQSALNPADIVPGIGFPPEKMLRGRLFSYGDAQRYLPGRRSPADSRERAALPGAPPSP